MNWVTRVRSRLTIDRDLSEELAQHLDERVDDLVVTGLSPEAARQQARREFGNVTLIRERAGDVWRFTFIEDLWADVRYACRQWRRSPSFTVAALLTLTLGLGANATIFSLLDALLLKQLPVTNPQDLVVVGRGGDYSLPVYQAFRATDGVFQSVFATAGIERVDVAVADDAFQRIDVSFVSGSYFSVLGVPALLGRTFTDEDDRWPGGHQVAVASHEYWKLALGGNPDVIGQTIRTHDTLLTIIGVAPPGFFGERVGSAPDLWVPLSVRPLAIRGRNLLESRGTAWLKIIGRLKPGVTSSAAASALTTVLRQTLFETFGPNLADDEQRDIAAAAVTLYPASTGLSTLRARFARPLQILMWAVALVLMIACANVANLLLARAHTRRREIGLRVAVGVSRSRLVRQLVVESLLLSGSGGLLSFGVWWWGRRFLLTMVSVQESPVALQAVLDSRLLLFVIGLSVVTGVLFGLAPIWQATRLDAASLLGNLRQPGHAGGRTGSRLLIVAQIALSLVLVVGAGLFARSLVNLQQSELGFVRDNLLVLDIDPQAAGYTGARYQDACMRVLNALNTVTGVRGVTLSENGVLAGRDSSTNRMRPAGFTPGPNGVPSTRFDVVGPDYFGVMSMTRMAGRDFETTDDGGAPRVIAINEQMARMFFAGRNPLGAEMVWGPGGTADQRWEVIAVVRDVRDRGPRLEAGPRFYVPYLQWREPALASARFIVRTAGASAMPALLRQAVLSEDTRLAVRSISTASDLLTVSLLQERLVAVLSGAFGLLAVGLAAVGVYGLMAYLVAGRTAEFGVRRALGASHIEVFWLVMRQDLLLIVVGVSIGIPLAVAGARLIRGLLFGIVPGDPVTVIAATLIMLLAGLIAGYAPARRATRIEPLIALRAE